MAVRLVTNPGSNLSQEMVERYRVRLSPQYIVVDGEEHDTRLPIELSRVDEWVSMANVHPYVVGSTAAEQAQLFHEMVRAGHEPLVLATSRKVIKTYQAAQTAARSVRQLVSDGASIRIVDCGVTDLGVALALSMAGEALAEGRTAAEVVGLLEAYARSARMVWTLESLDYAVKGGRATGARAFLANLLRVRPIMAFVDGEAVPDGKMRVGTDPIAAVLDHLEASIPRGTRIGLAVFHGEAHSRGVAMVAAAEDRYEVVFKLLRPLSPGIYLNSGKGAVGLCAVPMDTLPFEPSIPAPGLD